MNIELIDKRRIKIHLSLGDLESFNTDFEMLDYKNAQTKELVWDLLTLAKIQTGFDATNKKICIEAFPSADRGCTLYVTLLKESAPVSCPIKSEASKRGVHKYVAYSFENFEHLLSACGYIADLKASLYTINEKYVLLTSAESYDLSGKTEHILQQYANNKEECGRLYKSYLCEHGKLLIEDDAANKLTEIF